MTNIRNKCEKSCETVKRNADEEKVIEIIYQLNDFLIF